MIEKDLSLKGGLRAMIIFQYSEWQWSKCTNSTVFFHSWLFFNVIFNNFITVCQSRHFEIQSLHSAIFLIGQVPCVSHLSPAQNGDTSSLSTDSPIQKICYCIPAVVIWSAVSQCSHRPLFGHSVINGLNL